MKCLSTSTCLVLSCCTRLCAICIVDLLSRCSLIGFFQSIFMSSKIIFNHCIPQIPKVIGLNSIFILAVDITFCFLLLYVTIFLKKKVQYLEVNLLSSTKLSKIILFPLVHYQAGKSLGRFHQVVHVSINVERLDNLLKPSTT